MLPIYGLYWLFRHADRNMGVYLQNQARKYMANIEMFLLPLYKVGKIVILCIHWCFSLINFTRTFLYSFVHKRYKQSVVQSSSLKFTSLTRRLFICKHSLWQAEFVLLRQNLNIHVTHTLAPSMTSGSFELQSPQHSLLIVL